MIILKEVKENNQSIFKRIHADDNEKVIFEDTIYNRLYKISDDAIDTLVLYNDNMEVISEAYNFINVKMANKSYNSREKSMYAIRILYCFLKLTRTKLSNLKNDDIEKLKYFLLGYSPNKGSYSMNLLTVRKNGTVNGYLNIYRSYLKYLNIKCDNLFEIKEQTVFGINPLTEKVEKFNAYKSNLKTGTPINRVPKYISVNDFSNIIEVIRNDKNLLAECMVRLMYQFGLRLGEVLGLTFEDLKEIQIEGKLYPVLYIRNRASDKPFQKAKTCMNIVDKMQYGSEDYHTENLGYQKVIITYDIYELLFEYIEEAHTKAHQKNLQRYNHSVCTDKTSKGKFTEDNYYIFINSIGTILSGQTWNKYIKNVFKRVKLTIDEGSKKTNLNHRFRHGFAMFHVQYKKTPLLELQDLMRHASISSTVIYYNPTEEDEAKIKNEFVNELYDLIPSLKENIHGIYN